MFLPKPKQSTIGKESRSVANQYSTGGLQLPMAPNLQATDKEPAQQKFPPAQMKAGVEVAGLTPFKPTQKKENKTGLQNSLKAGIENLPAFSMHGAKEHSGLDKHEHANDLANLFEANNAQRISPNKPSFSKEISSKSTIQRVVEINGATYNNEAGIKTITEELKKIKIKLSDKQSNLLREWVMARGPLAPFGLRIYNGIYKKYPDYEELYMALEGSVSAAKNLAMETEFAKKIPSSDNLKTNLNSLAQKIYAHIESVKSTLPKNNIDFWKEASSSYRGLWNFVGVPYNFNYYVSRLGAFSSPMSISSFPNFKPPAESLENTLSEPEGDPTSIFASIKQVSNVYNDRKGKINFRTPRLTLTEEGKIEPVPDQFEQSGEKRYNTQSLKEKETWTKHARKKHIPVSAGASGSMDRMYRLANDAGATEDELVALALAGHYVFNQVYTYLSNDPHTFHEIMDTLHPYINPASDFPLSYLDRIKKMKSWL